MIDTHAHLTSLDDADEAINRASEVGVTRILAALQQPQDLSWDRVMNGVAEEVGGIVAAKPLFPKIEPPAAAA